MAQVQNPLPPHNELRTAIYIYTALIIVGILLIVFLAPWIGSWEPIASARQADNTLTLIVFTAIAVPVFMFVIVFGFYNLIFYRHSHNRGEQRPATDGPYFVASRGTQIAWIGITAAHALLLFFWGLIFLGRADAAPAPGSNQLNIDVTGEQWQFNFTYPQYGNAQSEILELPVNRPVYFTITSIDVVHSFAVDALGFKEDAVPGVFTHIRVTPNKIGDYTVRCYELCGLYHTYMEAPVRVVSDADFTSWVNSVTVHGYPWGINGAGAPNGAIQQPASSFSSGPPSAYAPPGAATAVARRPD